MDFNLAHNEHKHVTAMSVKMLAIVKKTGDGNILGELNCKYFEEPLAFSSFMNMIEIMETTFDAKGFPEKHMLPRTFGNGKQRIRKHEADLHTLLKDDTHIKERNIQTTDTQKEASAPVDNDAITSGDATDQTVQKPEALDLKQIAKSCTFEILVRFRHNAEWQGSIKWLERDVTKQFSSIVELIKLLDNALAE